MAHRVPPRDERPLEDEIKTLVNHGLGAGVVGDSKRLFTIRL